MDCRLEPELTIFPALCSNFLTLSRSAERWSRNFLHLSPGPVRGRISTRFRTTHGMELPSSASRSMAQESLAEFRERGSLLKTRASLNYDHSRHYLVPYSVSLSAIDSKSETL